MIEILFYLFVCFLITTNILYIWFKTDFPVHIHNSVSCLKKDTDSIIYSREDWETTLLDGFYRFGIFDFSIGDMLICPLCFGSWISYFSGVFSVLMGAPIWFPILSMFSIPFLAYLTLQYFK